MYLDQPWRSPQCLDSLAIDRPDCGQIQAKTQRANNHIEKRNWDPELLMDHSPSPILYNLPCGDLKKCIFYNNFICNNTRESKLTTLKKCLPKQATCREQWLYKTFGHICVLYCADMTVYSFIYTSLTQSTRRVTDQSHQTSLLILYIKLSSAMGFTWILGFIDPFTEVEFIAYLFVILNSLQGKLWST